MWATRGVNLESVNSGPVWLKYCFCCAQCVPLSGSSSSLSRAGIDIPRLLTVWPMAKFTPYVPVTYFLLCSVLFRFLCHMSACMFVCEAANARIKVRGTDYSTLW